MTSFRTAVLFALAILLLSVPAYAAAPNGTPEFRAMWVDGFNSGIRTPEEAHQLVADAKKANFNLLIVQVRRRGDTFYVNSIDPPVEDAPYDPKFDALAYIVDLAHKDGIQVHAWVNAMTIWKNQAPPKDPKHVFHTHGINVKGPDNWLNAMPDGTQLFEVGYFLDPGHPGAMDYLAGVYSNLVRSYDVDGIHFDYIRYPETLKALPRGAECGYNAVSIARFQRATGRTDVPKPDDEEFTKWRRQQVTNLVRRVYLEAKSIKPKVVVSAAVIAWGQAPVKEKDFYNSAPGQRIFQDWNGWLKDGILDMAVPMNYAREVDPKVREYWNGWIAFEKKYKHGRHMVVGIGSYLNAPESNLAQVSRVRQPLGNAAADGVSFFNYTSLKRLFQPRGEAAPLATKLTMDALIESAFTAPAPAPKALWIEQPTTGYVFGRLTAPTPAAADGVTISIRRSGFNPFRGSKKVVTDGNGYFGLANLKPGSYDIKIANTKVKVSVEAGKVSRADLGL